MYVYLWPDLAKAGLHTHNGKANFSPIFNLYINELTIHVCIIAIVFLVCIFWSLFLGPVWHAPVLKWSSNGSGLTRQAPTRLEITTWLAKKLGHQIGYYLWYLELKWGSGETIWQCQLVHVKKPTTSWFPTTPDLHPYMIILW